jgi:hypothetical protein
MTENFDKFFYSIIKESPDSITVNGEYMPYESSEHHITGLMMQHDNSKFICTTKKNPAKIIGHTRFQNKLKREFLSIKSSIVTNLSKKEIKLLEEGSLSMHDKIDSAIRFRIYNTSPQYYSFWGKMTKKKFDGAVAILNFLKINPNNVKWDVSVATSSDPHSFGSYNELDDNGTPVSIPLKTKTENDKSTRYYTFNQLNDFFNSIDIDTQEKIERDEERKRLEQAELELQAKLKSYGFSGRTIPYWQK